MKQRSFLIAISLATLARPAVAAEPVGAADGSLESQRRARALLDQGDAAVVAGEDDQARELYLESFAIYPSYDVACNLGMLESEAGRFGDAANHLTFCLEHYASADSLKRKQTVMDALARAKQYVTELTIEVRESGVHVLMDATELGTSPLPAPLFVTPGEHEFTAKKDGREVTEQANLPLGRSARIELRLPQPASSAVTPTGPEHREVVNPSLRWATSLTLLGLGVAGLGLGVGSWLHADHEEAQFMNLADEIAGRDGYCVGSVVDEDCDELFAARNRANTASNVAIAGFIGGGALIGAAALTYFLWPHRGGESRASLAPHVVFGPGGMHLSVRGTF